MHRIAIMLLAALLFVSGCAQTSNPPAEALRLSKESLLDRQLQMRRYETDKEEKMLAASAALLQDLGFNLDESESRLGVISASKRRDARESGQMVRSFLVAALTGVYMPTDKDQKIFASIVTRPASESSIVVRVTFSRIVWNDQKQISKQERINEPKYYQAFFDKLSKSVFLEANQI